MRFTFVVECEVEREQGKFATRDEIAGQIMEALDGANPGQITGDEGGEYNVSDWSVEEQPQAKKKRRRSTVHVGTESGRISHDRPAHTEVDRA